MLITSLAHQKKTKKITYKYNDSDNNVTKYFNQQEYNSYVLVQSDNIYESNNLIQAKNIYKKNGENDSIVNISYKYNRNNLLTFATATDNNMNFLDDYHYRFFDDLGNQIEIKSSKRHRKLIKGTDVSIIKYKYDDCGNMIEEKFFDYYDNETVNKEGISKIRYVYNNENQIIEIINLNHKDNLVSDSDGIAKIVRTFILDTVLFKGSSILINENYLDEFNNILEKKEDIISEYAKTEASKQFIFALRSRREIGLTQTIERIKYAINLNPYYYEAYKSLGEYYLDEEKYNLAEEAFLKAANNNDSSFSSEIFSELAKVTFYLEEYNKSLDYINRSINLEIGSEIDDRYMYSCPVGQKLLYRVEIKIQLGLYQSAINDCDLLERMLNSYPSTCFYQFEMFNFLKGYIYTFLIKGNYLEAIESLNRAIEMNSNDGSYFYTRGSAYYFLKYFDNACRDFKKSADLGFPDGINAVKNACN
jgi:tetratricopeptide (TPR) repeat protein